jgi:hypothetical protein
MKRHVLILIILFCIHYLLPAQNAEGYIHLSGNVKKDGEIVYCRMIIYEKVSLKTVYSDNVCISDQDFAIIIPKGKYNVYLRYFSPGEVPVEFNDISFQNDTTIIFNYNPIYPTPEIDSKISSLHPSKPYLNITNDSLNLLFVSTEYDFFDTIYCFNEFNNLSHHRIPIAKITLKDDGKDCDLIAHDGIFTSDYLTYNKDRDLQRGNDDIGGMAISYLYFLQLMGKTGNFYANLGNKSSAIAFSAIGVDNPNIIQISDVVYKSDYVMNVISPKATQEFTLEDFRDIYMKLLFDGNIIDEFDFINWFFPESISTGNYHAPIQQNILGIGYEISDNSNLWGSNQKLKGFSAFYGLELEYPIVHETMHQWGNGLDLFNNIEYGNHWGYSSVYGILGGFDEGNFKIINDNLVQILNNNVAPFGWIFNLRCSDLEMYLAGLIPLENLRSTYYVLNDSKYVSDDLYSVSNINIVTPQMIINKYGNRSPNFSTSQKNFRFINIVMTTTPLDISGFAFYDFIVKEFSHYFSDGQLSHNNSFEGATNNNGKADSRLGNSINTLSVTPFNRDVGSDAGSTTFSISSNTNWTISDDSDWLTASQASGSGNGTITATYSANTLTTTRVGIITISGTGINPHSVSVTQIGINTLSVTPSNRYVNSEEGSTSFTIDSNTNWSVSDDANWLTVSPTSGNGNSTLIVSYTPNTLITSRVGTITVSGSGVSSQSVSVTQSEPTMVNILEDLKASIYPNPTKDYIFIKLDGSIVADISISIVDELGKSYYFIEHKGANFENGWIIDLTSIKSGFYFVVIRSETIVKTYKIIKE